MPYKDPVKAKENAKSRGRFYYVRHRKKPEYKAMMKRLNTKWRTRDNPAYVAWREHSEAIRRLRRFLRGGRVKRDYIEVVCQCCGGKCVAPFKQNEMEKKMRNLIIFMDMLAESHQR